MKKLLFTLSLLFTAVGGAWCQNDSVRFTPEQQAIIDLSNQKWTWMAEKDVDKLEKLFHTSSQFVHMGGYWGKYEDEILNYFKSRATNASAESLNSKLKTFRSQLRGVRDIPFFFYRISLIFG